MGRPSRALQRAMGPGPPPESRPWPMELLCIYFRFFVLALHLFPVLRVRVQ
jgi:hypothetical protein